VSPDRSVRPRRREVLHGMTLRRRRAALRGATPGASSRSGLFPDRRVLAHQPVHRLADQVGLTVVAGVLVDQVDHDPPQVGLLPIGWRRGPAGSCHRRPAPRPRWPASARPPPATAPTAPPACPWPQCATPSRGRRPSRPRSAAAQGRARTARWRTCGPRPARGARADRRGWPLTGRGGGQASRIEPAALPREDTPRAVQDGEEQLRLVAGERRLPKVLASISATPSDESSTARTEAGRSQQQPDSACAIVLP